MATIWDEIDDREARYKAECAKALESIKGMIDARHPATCVECGRAHDPIDGHNDFESPVGEITCGQDEFGWWRATVKLQLGRLRNLDGTPVLREIAYQARSSEGLVQAVRLHKETPP